MPAGPVGSVWASGSWLDTVWEENTWADIAPPPPPGEKEYTVSFMMGVPLAIAQTTAYALPGRTVRIQSTVAVEVSVDNVTWSALANSSTVGETSSAMFLRCTSSTTCVVVVKPA